MPNLVVCLGAIGAGKTTLLNKLQNKHFNEIKEDSGLPVEPLATVGINHFDIDLTSDFDHSTVSDSSKNNCFSFKFRSSFSTNKCIVEIKEFGGSLAPAWKSYLQGLLKEHYDKSGVLYIVDVSNASRFAEVGVHLIETVQIFETLRKTSSRVLIVFSKVDLLDSTSKTKILNEARLLLRLDYLSRYVHMSIITISSQKHIFDTHV